MADVGSRLTTPGDRVAGTGFMRRFRAARRRRRDRSGVDEPRRWRARPLIWVLTFFTILAALAVLALKTGCAQRYCWIDESGVGAPGGSPHTGIENGPPHRQLSLPP